MPKLLVCIYTCQSDHESLEAFESSTLYQSIATNPSIQIYKIYAGSESLCICTDHGCIYLPCDESYAALSMKTYLMIKYSLQFQYEYMVKIDSTLASYRSIKHSKSEKLLRSLSPERAAEVLSDYQFFCRPYNGLVMQRASKQGFENWARIKRLDCSYEAVFPSHAATPPYYLGKLYSLRRDFCTYIAKEGFDMAREHVAYLGGAEDLMIGRLYESWLKSKEIGTP